MYSAPGSQGSRFKARRKLAALCGLALASLGALFLHCRQAPREPAILVRVRPDLGISLAGTRFVLIREDPNVLHSELQFEPFDSDWRTILEALRVNLEKSRPAEGLARPAGEIVFKDPAPGRYWVVNLEPVRWQGLLLTWAHPVTVTADGQSAEISLQISNAASVLDNNK